MCGPVHTMAHEHTQKDAQMQTQTHMHTLHARAHAFENREAKQTEEA